MVSRRVRQFFTILLALALSLPLLAHAQAPVAKVNSFVGEVFVRSAVATPRGEWRRVTAAPVNLFSGDEVRTERGRTEIIYPNDDAVRILENSTTRLTTTEETRRFLFFTRTVKLRTVAATAGRIWANVTTDRENEVEFRSPVAVASVRGTQLEFNVNPATGATFYGVAVGRLAVTAQGVSVGVGARQGSSVARGLPPTPPFPYAPPPAPAITAAAMEAALAAPPPVAPAVPAELAVPPPAPAAGAPAPPAVPSGGGGGGAASPSVP